MYRWAFPEAIAMGFIPVVFSGMVRTYQTAAGIAAGRGDTESIDRIGKYENIEVIMPEMVKVNPNKEHGSGNEFLNDMESIINKSDSVLEAGMLCLALTGIVK